MPDKFVPLILSLFEWSNFNFFHSSQWITFPILLCFDWHAFCANLPRSLIIGLILCLYHHIIIIIIILLFASFHASDSWWYFTEIWVTASLLEYPGLYSVFKLILIMQWSGWSRFFLWFSISQVFFPRFRRPFQEHPIIIGIPHPHLPKFSGKIHVHINLFPFFIFTLLLAGRTKSTRRYKFFLSLF